MTIEYFAESNPVTRTLPRSLATKAGDFVFVSGQVARDEDGSIVVGGIEAHTRQTLKNVWGYPVSSDRSALEFYVDGFSPCDGAV